MRALLYFGTLMLWMCLGANSDINQAGLAETQANEGINECAASLRRVTAEVKEGAKEFVELREEHRYT